MALKVTKPKTEKKAKASKPKTKATKAPKRNKAAESAAYDAGRAYGAGEQGGRIEFKTDAERKSFTKGRNSVKIKGTK